MTRLQRKTHARSIHAIQTPGRLRGAIDLHVHGGPDWVERLLTESEPRAASDEDEKVVQSAERRFF